MPPRPSPRFNRITTHEVIGSREHATHAVEDYDGERRVMCGLVDPAKMGDEIRGEAPRCWWCWKVVSQIRWPVRDDIVTTTHAVIELDNESRTHVTHAVEWHEGARRTLCDSIDPSRIGEERHGMVPTCERCRAKMLAPPRPPGPVDVTALRVMIADVLASPRPPATKAHALAREAVALCDETEATRGRSARSGPRAKKVGPDARLIQRAMAARSYTMSALAAEVGVSVSVLSRADMKAIPKRVRGLLRAMVGEPGGEEPVAE